ncbi:MAG: DUF819 family protein [Bacteroidetes bacterium]|nr:DUF819 family protein [Bacteroidota bacterium]
MQSALLIIFYFFTPILINFICYKYSFARKIGAVLFAYLIGLIIGNVGIFPEASLYLRELITNSDIKLTSSYLQGLEKQGLISGSDLSFYSLYTLRDTLTTITIAFALPLMLLSLNIRAWFKVAGRTFLSLLLGLVSVVIPIFIGYFLFSKQVDESWKIAGMMTGVYSGGTPNLASIQKALGVDSLTYILTHTYDLIMGAVFLLFVMSIGQRVLLRFLPKYSSYGENSVSEANDFESVDRDPFLSILKKKHILPLLVAFGITVLIIGMSAGIGKLIAREFQMMVIILSITTFSILISLIKRVNRIEKTFDTGMYFILVFSLVVASMADLRNFSSSHLHIFYWVALVYGGSLIIHVALAAIFKIDADNVIIVSTALTCSPPFVPVVAAALKNKEIIISGITVGIIGYAIGNYLGVSFAYLFKSLAF